MYQVWENEVDKRNPEQELLGRAIKNCIEIDKKSGRTPSLD